MTPPTLARFAREIERRWSELLERPVVLSPGDWRWISEWHQRGIPLQLIGECIDRLAERRGRSAKPPRGLGLLAPCVDEAWSVVVDGRRATAEPAAAEPGAVAAWRWRLAQERSGSVLARLLESLLLQLEAGAESARIDAMLDERLPEVVPSEVLREVEEDVRRRLGPYRSRLTAEQLADALARARLGRLRKRLQLPRLGGLPPAAAP